MKTLYRYVTDYKTKYGAVPLLVEYVVQKTTPEGYWVFPDSAPPWITGYERLRWVPKGATRAYAHTTKEKALKSYRARKAKYLKHLAYRYDGTKAALRRAAQLAEQQGFSTLANSKFGLDDFDYMRAEIEELENDVHDMRKAILDLVFDLEALGFHTDEPVSGADCVDTLGRHYEHLKELL